MAPNRPTISAASPQRSVRRAALYPRLQQQAYAALDRRLKAYEQLKTADEIRAYQAKLRSFFLEQIGGLPERTLLNAQTVGTIDADGYRIEKVIFESQPQHHVTANFYIPGGNGPFPGVIVSSGHSRTAKTADYNPRFGIALATHGLAALCFDPIGQGERSQILNDDGQPQFGSTTREHFLIGVGATLVGRNTARYRIWDAMRAIDYLCERPEIDPAKIGMTGCSGGGTLTSYVMALDDRVACAAPACYLTTFRRLIETIGPQDAEQNIFGQLGFGMEPPRLRADARSAGRQSSSPRPTTTSTSAAPGRTSDRRSGSTDASAGPSRWTSSKLKARTASNRRAWRRSSTGCAAGSLVATNRSRSLNIRSVQKPNFSAPNQVRYSRDR